MRFTATLAAAITLAAPAFAETHEIRMLSRGADGAMMVFEPAYLEIAPGDSVTFLATEKSHNTETVDDMLPEGFESWKGKRDEEITVTFDAPGYYPYKCKPHEAMGMVGLIKVGEPGSAPKIGKLRGKAVPVMEELLARAGS
ncbi:pseudoazurin [Limimaricola sp. G21655-S1]|jgi:pseudoazurin|uniref:pseudoazurin n=1 Tax=Limimaricola sp. G21655-S1 TaxID=3014768 RepID=UPI0022AF9AA7|nr:pseudoazurin [Limimaricola sp. G21655-S1]MCZ4262830.1 pseudoazurin [Limimaricola sp. G21655-S1]